MDMHVPSVHASDTADTCSICLFGVSMYSYLASLDASVCPRIDPHEARPGPWHIPAQIYIESPSSAIFVTVARCRILQTCYVYKLSDYNDPPSFDGMFDWRLPRRWFACGRSDISHLLCWWIASATWFQSSVS